MDKQEAKLILSSYTLGELPKNDSQIEEAKRIVQSDPELAQWWEEQRLSDVAIQTAIKHYEVPSDLRSALKASIAGEERKRIRFNTFSRWATIAALFVLSFVMYYEFGIDRSDSYTGTLAERAINYSVDGPRLKYFNRDTQNLKTWLVSQGFDLPSQLPPKLLEQEGIGCRPLDWSDQRVALMCFNADTTYHLFIGNEKDFPDFDASEEIGYAQHNKNWSISKWRDQDHLFVLTAKASPEEMSQMLASYNPLDLGDS